MAASGAARRDDQVTGVDSHIVLVPSASGTVPTPLPHPFAGKLGDALSGDVQIEGRDAATVGSVAPNQPKHVPTPPGTSFQRTPANRGTVAGGSDTVLINGRKAARIGDPVRTCNDPADRNAGTIVSGSGTVLIG
ncbi:PAAR domain-containing protein [Nonomuraea sp. NPDC050153]|uniref:PAAR domain-containing protein n=1 Tax=Nonomuraea sp. NPDC050153 TaxID=3364359 RepID=UPI00378812DA